MIGPRAAAFVASLLLGSGGCLLYTDDINTPPSVSISAPTFEPARSAPVQVIAQATDQQDGIEHLGIHWIVAPGACPSDAEAAPPSNLPESNGPTYSLVITGFEPVCLFVRVNDSQSAWSPWQHHQFTGRDRAPLPVLDISPPPAVNGAVPLYTRLRLSAAMSSDPDGDNLSYEWQLMTPDGPAPLEPCGIGTPESIRCFVPRKSGRYTVQLTVAESLPAGVTPALAQPQMRVLDVQPDQPPCLEVTSPQLYQDVVLIPSGTKRTFGVSSVRDDGEPYPGPGENGRTIFVWSIPQAGATKLEPTALNDPTFEVGESLFGNARPGDQFRVRVEVRDTLLQKAMGDGHAGPPCDDSVPTCKDATGCVHWTTWRVQFHP